MEHIRVRIFTFLAQLGVLSAVYAVTELLRYWFYRKHLSISYFLFAILIMLWGLFTCILVTRGNPKKSRLVISYALYLIPAVFIFAAASHYTSGELVLELLAGFIFYFTGITGGLSDYRRILNNNTMIVCGLMLAVSYMLSLEIKYIVNIWVYINIYILDVALMLSQKKIDSAFRRDDNVLFRQIGGIRTFSATAVMLFAAVCLAAFNFWGLKEMGDRLWNSFSRALGWLFLFFTRLFSNPAGIVKYDQGGRGNIFDVMDTEYGKPSIFTLVVYIVGLVVLLIIVFFLSKRFRRLLSRFAAYIRSLLAASAPETLKKEYYDIIEKITGKHHSEQSGSFRRELSRLSRITDPVSKVRYLYGLMIDALLFRKISLKKSDTTGEICRKTLDLNIRSSAVQINRLTLVYNGVRYGDRLPESRQVSEIERDCIGLFEELGLTNETKKLKGK